MTDLQQVLVRIREDQFAQACELARVGVRTVQSRDRTADTARRRAVVAWVLFESFEWRQREIAAGLGVTVRAVKKMLGKSKVSSPSG